MTLNTRALHEQLAAIMSTLSRAALSQMCAAVDQGFSALHAELLRQHKENEQLKKKLHLIESIVVNSSGTSAGGKSPGGSHSQQGPDGGSGAEESQGGKAPDQIQEDVGIKHEDPDSGGAVGEDVQCGDSRGASMPRAEDSLPMRTPCPEAGSSSSGPGTSPTFKCEVLNVDLQVVEQHPLDPPSACGPIFSSSAVVSTQTLAQKVEMPSAWSSSFESYQPENCDAFGLKVVSVSGSLSENSSLDFSTTEPGFGQSFEVKSGMRIRGRGRGRGSGPKCKRFDCSICQKVLATAQALESHMRIHTGERPFKCEECGKRFTQACHLKSHCLSIHGNPPHPCLICGRGFSSLGTLQTHMKRWHPNYDSISTDKLGMNQD